MPNITRYDETSYFPAEIDELLCLEDIDLDHINIPSQHEGLLSAHRYTDAGELLESSDIDSMCASLFNLLENRIYATQEYINGKHTQWYIEYGVESPFECFEEPKDKTKKPVWTNIEDLSRINFGGLGSGYRLSAAGGIRT